MNNLTKEQLEKYSKINNDITQNLHYLGDLISQDTNIDRDLKYSIMENIIQAHWKLDNLKFEFHNWEEKKGGPV